MTHPKFLAEKFQGLFRHVADVRRITCLSSLLFITAAFGQTNDAPKNVGATNSVSPDQLSASELKNLSLEELMNIEVTSVSKRPEKLSSAAAAIEVITQEDVQRSGVTTIQEAMRLLTGYEVARVDAHRYAITARGFNGEFADKLQVLIDGRSIYSPVFSGVLWDQQSVMLEDLDRIEGIRGPGSTLWGANAVNGVLNITTKSAQDTQGTLLSAGVGTEDRWSGAARYGGKIGDDAYFRVYGTTANRDEEGGGNLANGWEQNQGGFRVDWDPNDPNHVTFQGDYYGGTANERDMIPTSRPPAFSEILENRIHFNGGNLLSRWTHTWSEESQTEFLSYYDHYSRGTLGSEEVNIGDVELQHRFMIGEKQEIVAGLGYRVVSDETGPGVLAFSPPSSTMQLFSFFAQDQVFVVPEKLNLTFGAKFEHNDFTGMEIQPTVRLAWTPTSKQTIWTAFSRATRTPSRLEHDIDSNFATDFANGTPVFIHGEGNSDLNSEKLLAYELGYRAQPAERWTVDVATFYNHYSDLISQEPTSFNSSTTPAVQTLTFKNLLTAQTYGVELAAQWRPLDWWTLRPSYTFLQMDVETDSGANTSATKNLEGTSPQHQFSLRSSMDLPRNITFDFWLRYVDALPAINIPSYVTGDIRVAWRPKKNLELAIVGQNLFQSEHTEFFEPILGIPGQPVPIERGVYGKVTWGF